MKSVIALLIGAISAKNELFLAGEPKKAEKEVSTNPDTFDADKYWVSPKVNNIKNSECQILMGSQAFNLKPPNKDGED